MQIKIHNVQTGQIIEREMNDEELAQWEADQAAAEAKAAKLAAEAEAKEAARAELLARLGITEDEAKLLLGSN
jgi:hypothetical protein